MSDVEVEITAEYYKQKAIDLLNSNFMKQDPIATYHKDKLRKYINEWFNTVDDKNLNKYISYEEDEDLFKEMFNDLFAPHMKNAKQALYCMRLAYEFVADQRILSREIFENIEKLRYTQSLRDLDGYPDEFATRQEAVSFFEKTLMPYAKDEAEKSAFWAWMEAEMVFDGEPSQKKIKQ